MPADYSKEDAEFIEIEQKYLKDKIAGLKDTGLTQEDFMIKYPVVSEELEKTIVFSPQQKVALRQDLKKVSDTGFKRFSVLGRDYAKEYNYTPQSDADILNAELDYMTKKIQNLDGTGSVKVNREQISKDIETSVIFKPQEKEAFRMALGMVSKPGGNSNAQTPKVEEVNKRDYAKEYNYTPQSDADILKAEQDYLKNKIAKANQEIDKFNDNIVYGQEDKKGLNDAYDKIHGKISQEIKNTVVFSPGEKERLGTGKFEPIEQDLDTAGYPGWKVGNKAFNSIDKAKEYQNKQRAQRPTVSANLSSATVNTGSAVPEIVEGGDEFGRVWTVGNEKFYLKEKAVEYQNTLKAPQSAGHGQLSQATPTLVTTPSPKSTAQTTPTPVSATSASTPTPSVTPAPTPLHIRQ